MSARSPRHRRTGQPWFLAGAILERTSRLRVFPDVANLPLRSPVTIAKTAARLDLLWSDERSVRFSGRHYELRGATPGPQPAHDSGL
ncbi:LLM class flavin-dependent oxidoreductase [Micromonospora lutea]|uniref:LLM class flavin-dependent oxidoreductase n=1 Tax=Micromonospora lutea TaxID=419825 RepID=UPI0027E4685D|nr:LLM class flavin-dependent oxidoreductase [Micromonospora lutea]